jgi:ribosome biogenesis GTPase / thiamine phosphate phosphatase
VFDLQELGWDDAWAKAFAPYAAEGLIPARVAIEFNHIFRLYAATGELQAQHSGRLLHQAAGRDELAAVGDWVAALTGQGEGTATIEAIVPRRTKFSRKVAGELTEEQVVAANIDTVFLVMGLDGDFNPRRVERYLLMAYESGASPVILLTKADLAEDVAGAVAEIERVAIGTPVHALSAREGSGLEVLDTYMQPGRTGTLLGSSGAGKSTLINALLGESRLKTQAVRSSDSRGRHTTRHRHLILLPGRGLLIDTPGMRELQVWSATDAVRETFDDIEELAAQCHFTDCRHQGEPRCAVALAIEEGTLSVERLASFHKLQDEVRHFENRRNIRAQIDEKRKVKTINQSMKKLYKSRE